MIWFWQLIFKYPPTVFELAEVGIEQQAWGEPVDGKRFQTRIMGLDMSRSLRLPVCAMLKGFFSGKSDMSTSVWFNQDENV